MKTLCGSHDWFHNRGPTTYKIPNTEGLVITNQQGLPERWDKLSGGEGGGGGGERREGEKERGGVERCREEEN